MKVDEETVQAFLARATIEILPTTVQKSADETNAKEMLRWVEVVGL